MPTNLIKVFEHDRLKIGDLGFTVKHFDSLAAFMERQKTPWFQLGYRCINFSHYVGVIQVDGLTIEILPKTDRCEDKSTCQRHLVEMLCQTGNLKLSAPSNALLKWKRRSILDMYIGYFVNEIQMLMHRGLIRRYRREQGNQKALKGRLLTGKQITKNLVHKERFFCEYTTYDRDHLLHQIINEALKLLTMHSGARPWMCEIRNLLMDMPRCKTIQVNDATFSTIHWDRKNSAYRDAISIVRMLLLNYHPDISSGCNDVLALLFNMNDLFERWILTRLKRSVSRQQEIYADIKVSGQDNRCFWSDENRNHVNVRPDIVVYRKDVPITVLDTKWKQMRDNLKPSARDLQQLFAYNHLFNVSQSYLLYPGNGTLQITKGWFGDKLTDGCGICLLPIVKGDSLNSEIGEELMGVLLHQEVSKRLG